MSDFGKLRRYTDASRTKRNIKREVNEELRLHIDMRAESYERAGMTPEEARAQAMREFGDFEDAAEYCGDLDGRADRRRLMQGWLTDLRQDVEHAFRLLKRTPTFAAATVVTLALAFGASTAVYGVLHAYLIRPLPYAASDRLMFLGMPENGANRPTPSLRGVDWTRVDSALFDASARWDVDGFTLSGGSYAETVSGAWATVGYFRALDIRPAFGRRFRDEEYRDQAPVALISHGLWLRRFAGDSGIIGSTVAVRSAKHADLSSTVTIVGILPRDYWPIQSSRSDLLLPLADDRAAIPMLVRLKRGMSSLDAERRLTAAVRGQLGAAGDSTIRLKLTAAQTRSASRVRPLLLAVFGASLFMLLAACASVGGALVSRASARRAELGIRLALGGSRARIVRQLLTEAAVLSALGGVLGLAFAFALIHAGGPVIEGQLGTSIAGGADALLPNGFVIGLSLFTSIVAGVGLGLVPALTFLQFDFESVASAMFGVRRGGSARSLAARTRKTFIACQVAVAMILMFGAGLMFETIGKMARTELGFGTDGVMRASVILPEAIYADSAAKLAVLDRVLARASATPGVASVAAVFPQPFGTAYKLAVVPEGFTADEKTAPRATVFTASSAYFETMGLPLRAGRAFQGTDDQRSPFVAIVSEALARRIDPSGNVIGRRVRFFVPYTPSFDGREDLPWRTIVGVVGDTKKEFSAETIPDVYVPYSQNPRSYIGLVARTNGDVASVVEPMRRAVAAVDPSLALYDIGSVEDLVISRGGQRRGLMTLLASFGAFALVLTALALYASLSYTVVQRKSELAVRVAIGADTRRILWLVIGEGLWTTCIGLVLGGAASVVLSRVLEHQLYGVRPGDPKTLVSIAVVLAVAATGACAIPARNAARTNPVLALRE